MSNETTVGLLVLIGIVIGYLALILLLCAWKAHSDYEKAIENLGGQPNEQ